jgi:hypothetical protein
LLYGAIKDHIQDTRGEINTHQNSEVWAKAKQEVVEMQIQENGKKLSTGTAMSYAPRLIKPANKKHQNQ